MRFFAVPVVAATLAIAAAGQAQTIAPEFAADYAVDSLGAPPAVPQSLGGLAITQGSPNTLYIGGSANSPGAAVYSVAMTRDSSGYITGWGCVSTTLHASSPYIDGGLVFGPGGVLFYATYSNNTIGQIVPGGVGPARVIDLSALGVQASTGSLLFVPAGFAGEGQLKILSYNASRWYSTTVSPDGNGTFDLAPVSEGIFLGGGLEGAVYVGAGNPQFPVESVLVCEYGTGSVVAYEVDGNGDPIPTTRRIFVSGLSGAEGATIDPLTGDFLFCTYGGIGQVVRVSGFTKSASCIGDIDGDGQVNGADLGQVLAKWGDCPECAEDLNGDCVVNGLDLGVLLSVWGPCPN